MRNFNGFLVILLISLSTSVSCLRPNPKPTNSDNTIYIRSDGTVDPPTVPIQHEGNLYTFTDNINEPIVVQRGNITIDGNGYTLQGVGEGFGFYLKSQNNVTIRRVDITGFSYWHQPTRILKR